LKIITITFVSKIFSSFFYGNDSIQLKTFGDLAPPRSSEAVYMEYSPAAPVLYIFYIFEM